MCSWQINDGDDDDDDDDDESGVETPVRTAGATDSIIDKLLVVRV